MVNIHFYLRDNKTNGKSGVLLFVSLSGNGRTKIGTVENIVPKYWDDKKQRAKTIKSFPECIEFNTRLDRIESISKNTIREYLNNNGQDLPDPTTLKVLIKNSLNLEKSHEKDSITDFIDFVELFIEDCKSGKIQTKGKNFKPNTIKTFNTLLLTLKEFRKHNNYNTSFKSINQNIFEDLKGFMVRNKKYSINSQSKYLKTFKRIWEEANFRGYTNIKFQGHRFNTSNEQSDSVYLDRTELKKLEDLDLSKNPKLDNVRDLFLLGCNTGLRYNDLISLKSSDIKGNKIFVRSQKTDTPVVIPFNLTIERILKKYSGITNSGLPIKISQQKMNQHLKELCKLAGIDEPTESRITKGGITIQNKVPKYEKITTHTARRSFATNLYLEGFSTIGIMAITGHTTESAFMKYIRVTPLEFAQKLGEFYKLNGEL